MTVTIIDLLEVVEVEQGDAAGSVIAVGGEQAEQGRAIQDASEAIVAGQVIGMLNG